MTYETKKVAVVFLFEDNGKYLFLKRGHTGACDGFYMLPGGHVDEGEQILTAAVREIKEELDVQVLKDDLHLVLSRASKTHINFFFKVNKYTGTLKNKEPEKHDDLAFLSIEDEGIHPTVKKEINAIQTGVNFIDNSEEF